jgi:outer membrane protein OmpA-like peptidoglycan-associated protein
MTIGLALLVAAMPVAAQTRGTMEFGAFASNTSFDNSLALDNSWGGGARVGMYLHSRWMLEFEGGGASASRTFSSPDVNVGILSGRLTAVPARIGRLSLLLGAGVDHVDTDFHESYGFHGLVGAKLAFSERVALRVDGISSHMANGNGNNMGMHVGLSFLRRPRDNTTVVTRTEVVEVPAPLVVQRPDSVSAAETRRLREQEARYQMLRDSIANAPRQSALALSSLAAVATMQEMIYFKNDQSVLSDSAKAILRDKVVIFRENPAMRIVIAGFASSPGSAKYNMSLGLRRVEAAKAYLVSQGINGNRIDIATYGEGQLVVDGPGEAAHAANRRGEFRLLVADPSLTRSGSGG